MSEKPGTLKYIKGGPKTPGPSVFYDQRGTGLSPRVEKRFLTLEKSVEDLGYIVDHFAPKKKAILIGHSWGAMLAVAYAGRHPERVSNLIAAEPGMLHKRAAIDFVDQMKEHQGFGDVFFMAGRILLVPFVKSHDGHERFDFVMTEVLNRNQPGPPYQCPGQAMPDQSFVRAGYDAFDAMLKPVFDDPEAFTHELTKGIAAYRGGMLFLSSECSLAGFNFQQKHHIQLMPKQTQHVMAANMGHNFLTLNPEWSLSVIRRFLAPKM